MLVLSLSVGVATPSRKEPQLLMSSNDCSEAVAPKTI
jgi:hypothetical protein